MSQAPAIAVLGLTKRFGARTVVDNVNLTVQPGRICGFLGPNGSGKTTTLRMICGLLIPDAGEGEVLGLDLGTQRRAIKQQIGYMTQKFGLFGDLTIRENLEFIARVYGLDRKRQRVDEALEKLGLASRADQLAEKLSGGWKQRLALAAAVLHEPRILLLDEPLSALDARIRRSLRQQIREIQQRLELTTIFVTHDQEEALTLSDRIFLMNKGSIVQSGTPEQIYTRPASEFVAGFIGNYNLLGAEQGKSLFGPRFQGKLALRPESITLLPAGATSSEPSLPGIIRQQQLLGNVIRYQVECEAGLLTVDCLNRSASDLLATGSAVTLAVARDQLCEVA